VLNAPVLRHADRCWVAQNRWDQLPPALLDAGAPDVAIIVPYFNQPDSLRRMYAALATADLDPRRHRLVIADDGSVSQPPSPPPGYALPWNVVRQHDRGCRPGAARNLGAAATDAEVLVFLDADTIPSPRTIGGLARWPGALPDALVVGSRHHVDLTGWSADETESWLRGTRVSPARRPDPQWLTDGYRASHDLLDADERTYRFVISAVMACHRALFDDIGGFDGARFEYGGEDWEFAWRAFNNGAVLVHDPDAVAWHDEPDWADRQGDVADGVPTSCRRGGAERDGQALWLASMIPEPLTRGRGLRQRWPDTIVTIDGQPTTDGQLVATVHALLDAVPDCSLHLPPWSGQRVRRHVQHDTRVDDRPPTWQSRLRARRVISVEAPLDAPPATLLTILAELEPGGVGRIEIGDGDGVIATATTTRALGRARRAPAELRDEVVAACFGTRRIAASSAGVERVPRDVDLERLFGGW